MASLKESEIIDLKLSTNYIREYQACGLNSILAIIHHYASCDNIDITEIKSIFSYNEDGISNEKYRYNKLNSFLSTKRIPLKFYIKRYDSIQDLQKQLNIGYPVPIFFWMSVLNFTKKHYKNLEYQIDFGDVFQSDVKHVLMLVGYKEKGDKILFIDPSYQLPWIPLSEKDIRKHYFSLNKKDFYESTKHIKTFIEVKYLKGEAKGYKGTLPAKEKQEKLT
jgi:hypothetical protein